MVRWADMRNRAGFQKSSLATGANWTKLVRNNNTRRILIKPGLTHNVCKTHGHFWILPMSSVLFLFVMVDFLLFFCFDSSLWPQLPKRYMGTESSRDAWWTERHPHVHSCDDYHNLSILLTWLSPMTCTLATRLPDRGASKIGYDAHTTPAPPLLSLTLTTFTHLILPRLIAGSRTTYTLICSD